MRKALIDAEMELQQGAVATQDRRKTLQARFMFASMMHPEHASFPRLRLFLHCMAVRAYSINWESADRGLENLMTRC